MDERLIVHHGLAPEPFDHQANRAFYERMVAAFQGARLVVDDVVAEGDRLSLRFRLAGEHKGRFLVFRQQGDSFS